MGRLAAIALVVVGCGSSHPGAVDGAAGDDGPGGSDGAPVTCPTGTWCTETAPVATLLHAVWARTADDVFAVGNGGVIVRRVNGTWTQMTSGTTANLVGVWAASATDVWAVGDAGTVLRYDGNQWAPQAGIATDVAAVWGTSSSQAFLVGQGEVYAWNGAGFAPNALPGSPFAISGTGATDVWVTGESSKVSHFTGAWTTGIDPGAGATYFAILAIAPTDVWVAAAGSALHFDGANWTPHTVPATAFEGFYAIGATDVWAVGGTKAGHWDGNQWATEQPAGASASLFGIHGAGAAFWAVGDASLILHRD